MKKLLTLCSLLVICMGLFAQNADYLQKKDFQAEKKKISESISGLRKSLSSNFKIQDSLKQSQLRLNAEFKGLTDSLKTQSLLISRLQEKLIASQEKADSFKVYFYLALLISIVLVLIVFFYFNSLASRLKAEFQEADRTIDEKIESGLKIFRETLVSLEAKLDSKFNEMQVKWAEHADLISRNQAEYERSQQAFAVKLQDQFNEVTRATETADKSQKEAIHTIEEKLKTRWAATDAKLAEINAKLMK